MKRLSLRFKLILGAVLGLTLTLAAVILVGWMTMQKSGQEAVELAATSFEAQMVANLHDSAASVSTEVSVFINRSFDIPKTLGYKVSATASGSGSNAPPFQRSTVMQMVRDTLAANPALPMHTLNRTDTTGRMRLTLARILSILLMKVFWSFIGSETVVR